MSRSWEQSTVMMGESALEVVIGGQGPPLLVLHDELGFVAGWQDWHEQLSRERTLIIPLQPGYGDTEPIDWIRSYRDLATFYARLLREGWPEPIDVIGLSAGGFVAAEMAVAAPRTFDRMVLVAPLGVRPSSGEIFDFLAVTVRSHVDALVSDREREPYRTVFGGDLTPEQFGRIEEARAETARLGWEPFMFDPGLPHHLEGVGDLPVLLVWGEDDLICPRGCVDIYAASIPKAHLEILPRVGHCPDLEAPGQLVDTIRRFITV